MGSWRHAVTGMSSQLSDSLALLCFSSKSSGKEISQSVNTIIILLQKRVKVAHVRQESPPPLRDGNRRFGRISFSEAISECREQEMQDALADLQKNYCFFHSWFSPPSPLYKASELQKLSI